MTTPGAGRGTTGPPDTSAGPAGPGPGPTGPEADASLGDLVNEITSDLSRLFRDEVELAKEEVRQEAGKAGKAGGMLGGAGMATVLALVFGSLTLVLALSHVMDGAWAALLVTAAWAAAAGALFAAGRSRMRAVRLTPERTVDSLKEDARWARNPTG